jgi:hypothetical protein
MNATQTLIMDYLTASNSYHTVKEIQAGIGKGETTIRENLKVLLADGDVSKDGKLYTNTPIVPEAVEPEVTEVPKPEPVHASVEAIEEAIAAGEAAEAVVPQDEAVGAALDAAEAPAKKVYKRHATPTTRTVRINQITKSEVKVVRADEMDLEDADSKWYTLCLTHDHMEGSDLVLDAHFKSTYPEFCPPCNEVLNPADGPSLVGRRRAVKAN